MNAVPDPETGLRGCLGSQPGQDIDSAVAGTSQLFARRQLAGLLDHQTLTKLVLESQPSTWSNSEANNTFSQKLALVRERAVPALQLLLYAGHPAHQHTSSIIWALQHTHCAEAALVLADYTRHCLIPDPNADRATCDELALRAFTALSKQGQTGRPLRQALVHEWLTGASTSDKLLERAIQDYTRDSTVREKLIETGRFVLRCLRQTERPLTTSAKGRITSFYDTLVQIDDILSKPPVENCSIAIDILRPLRVAVACSPHFHPDDVLSNRVLKWYKDSKTNALYRQMFDWATADESTELQRLISLEYLKTHPRSGRTYDELRLIQKVLRSEADRLSAQPNADSGECTEVQRHAVLLLKHRWDSWKEKKGPKVDINVVKELILNGSGGEPTGRVPGPPKLQGLVLKHCFVPSAAVALAKSGPLDRLGWDQSVVNKVIKRIQEWDSRQLGLRKIPYSPKVQGSGRDFAVCLLEQISHGSCIASSPNSAALALRALRELAFPSPTAEQRKQPAKADPISAEQYYSIVRSAIHFGTASDSATVQLLKDGEAGIAELVTAAISAPPECKDARARCELACSALIEEGVQLHAALYRPSDETSTKSDSTEQQLKWIVDALTQVARSSQHFVVQMQAAQALSQLDQSGNYAAQLEELIAGQARVGHLSQLELSSNAARCAIKNCARWRTEHYRPFLLAAAQGSADPKESDQGLQLSAIEQLHNLLGDSELGELITSELVVDSEKGQVAASYLLQLPDGIDQAQAQILQTSTTFETGNFEAEQERVRVHVLLAAMYDLAIDLWNKQGSDSVSEQTWSKDYEPTLIALLTSFWSIAVRTPDEEIAQCAVNMIAEVGEYASEFVVAVIRDRTDSALVTNAALWNLMLNCGADGRTDFFRITRGEHPDISHQITWRPMWKMACRHLEDECLLRAVPLDRQSARTALEALRPDHPWPFKTAEEEIVELKRRLRTISTATDIRKVLRALVYGRGESGRVVLEELSYEVSNPLFWYSREQARRQFLLVLDDLLQRFTPPSVISNFTAPEIDQALQRLRDGIGQASVNDAESTAQESDRANYLAANQLLDNAVWCRKLDPSDLKSHKIAERLGSTAVERLMQLVRRSSLDDKNETHRALIEAIGATRSVEGVQALNQEDLAPAGDLAARREILMLCRPDQSSQGTDVRQTARDAVWSWPSREHIPAPASEWIKNLVETQLEANRLLSELDQLEWQDRLHALQVLNSLQDHTPNTANAELACRDSSTQADRFHRTRVRLLSTVEDPAQLLSQLAHSDSTLGDRVNHAVVDCVVALAKESSELKPLQAALECLLQPTSAPIHTSNLLTKWQTVNSKKSRINGTRLILEQLDATRQPPPLASQDMEYFRKLAINEADSQLQQSAETICRLMGIRWYGRLWDLARFRRGKAKK